MRRLERLLWRLRTRRGGWTRDLPRSPARARPGQATARGLPGVAVRLILPWR